VAASLFAYVAFVFHTAAGALAPGLILLPILAYLGHAAAWLAWLKSEPRAWKALAGAGSAIVAISLSGARFDAEFPKPVFATYAVDLESAGAPGGQAYWVTDPEHKHPWLEVFRKDSFKTADAPWFSPVVAAGEEIELSRAPSTALPGPELTVLESGEWKSGKRKVKFRLRSPRGARCLVFWEELGRPLTVTAVNGKPPRKYLRFSAETDRRLGGLLRPKSITDWTLNFCAAPPEGVVFELETPVRGKLHLRFQDKSEGFPASLAPTSERPPELIPAGGSDGTVLSRSAGI
jgi:hypothetical protein